MKLALLVSAAVVSALGLSRRIARALAARSHDLANAFFGAMQP
jgi:predicted benzoate:H+ symporter BenE